MKHRNLMLAFLPVALVAVCQAVAQDAAAPVAAEVEPIQSGGFFNVILSRGPLGVLTWAAIFFWAIAVLPLGVLSIVHSANLKSKRWPLSTKLLLFGPVFLLVLGWIGVVQGLIGMFAGLASGAPDVGLFALAVSQSLYSLAGTLFLMQFYLFFFLISFVVIHFKHKQMDGDS
jgi:hypothetical protein